MKKYFIFIALFGLMISCSDGKKQTEKTSEELHNKIEAIEKSTQELDESINSSDYEMEKHQNEIDSLLNNI